MATTKEIKIIANTKDAEGSIQSLDTAINGLNDEIKNTNGISKEAFGKIDGLTGGAITKFKSFKGSVAGVVTSMKTLRGAIIATGIGALLILITSLIAAFKSSEEGQNKWAKVLGVIGSVVGNFTDLLASLGEKLIWVFENPKQALIDFGDSIKRHIITRVEGILNLIPNLGRAIEQLFKGNFKEAGKIAADAIGQVTLGVKSITDTIDSAIDKVGEFAKEVADDANKAAIVANKRAKADKLERELLVERAKKESEIADLKLKAEQRDKYSAEQRAEFLKQALEGEDLLASKQQEIAQLRYDAISLENTLSNSNKDALAAEAQAQADLINIERDRNNKKKELTTKQIAFSKEAAEEEKKRLQEIADLQKEIQDAVSISEQEQRDLALLREAEKYDALIQQAISHNLSTEELEAAKLEKIQSLKDAYALKDKELEDKKIKEKQEQTDKELAIEEQKQQAIQGMAHQGFALLGQIAGKGSKMSKAIAVADTLYSTYTGIQSAFTTAAKSPYGIANPAYPYIQAGLAGAFGFSNLAKLKSSSGASSVSMPSSGGSVASAVSTPAINIVGQQSSNALLDSINRNTGQPVKAYVVSKEVTTQQELDRNRVATASI